MTRFLSTAAIALAFTVGAGAQSAPQSQPQSPSPSSTSTKDKTTKTGMMSSASKTVTLTGCLREGDTPNSFALDNVQMSGKSGETMSGAEHPSTGGTPAMGMPADMGQVKLVSTADINLKEHVGHEVQVSGTMTTAKGSMTKDKSSTTPSDTMGSGSGASSSSATGTSGAKSKDTGADAHTLRVRSLKHVSETCTK